MSRDPWFEVTRLLDDMADAGETARFWLRDDDAVTETPALWRLADICGTADLPVLLAVIPAAAEDRLGTVLARMPGFTPCQHGWQHRNHAAPGQRACELGGDRPTEQVWIELVEGRHMLQGVFGGRLADVLVPPWNRIEPAVIQRLPELGFKALSTFGPPPEDDQGIRRINCDIDVIDWRNGRVGRTAQDVGVKLADAIQAARSHLRPVGILTHHLAHDGQAWRVLEDLVGRLVRHPGAGFTQPI